jgi:hypothetical protein
MLRRESPARSGDRTILDDSSLEFSFFSDNHPDITSAIVSQARKMVLLQ